MQIPVFYTIYHVSMGIVTLVTIILIIVPVNVTQDGKANNVVLTKMIMNDTNQK